MFLVFYGDISDFSWKFEQELVDINIIYLIISRTYLVSSEVLLRRLQHPKTWFAMNEVEYVWEFIFKFNMYLQKKILVHCRIISYVSIEVFYHSIQKPQGQVRK